jgi:hypothetical protein
MFDKIYNIIKYVILFFTSNTNKISEDKNDNLNNTNNILDIASDIINTTDNLNTTDTPNTTNDNYTIQEEAMKILQP